MLAAAAPPIVEQMTRATGTDAVGYLTEGPGFSAFVLDDGTVYQTYSPTARGLEFLMGSYPILDWAPKGATKPPPPRSGFAGTSSTKTRPNRLRAMGSSSLPLRPGTRPTTTPTNPHTQLDQQPADSRWTDELARRIFALPGVVEAPSRISVPGSRALVLAAGEAVGPTEAFLIGREFAHLHPSPDHSLHAMLPLDTASEAVAAGWAEPHPVALRGLIPANAIMLYAPRDETGLHVIETLVRASYAFARPT